MLIIICIVVLCYFWVLYVVFLDLGGLGVGFGKLCLFIFGLCCDCMMW